MKKPTGLARCVLLALLTLGLTSAAYPQRSIQEDPGYVDFSRINDWFDEKPTLEVNIKGALLRLVAEASRLEDPELADLLLELRAIQVQGYSLPRSRFDDLGVAVDGWVSEMEEAGWDTIVRVRDDDEHVDMHVKVHDGAIAGMLVMVVTPGDDDTVFVNIVGEIDPEQIGRIGRRFNIDPITDNVPRRGRF